MACVEITQKEAKDSFRVFSCFNHEDVAEALRNHSTVYFYNLGVYGWNCHLFPITKGIALSMGYRPFGKKDKRIDEMVENLNKAISEMDRGTLLGYLRYRNEVEKLVNEFIENVEDYVIEEACNG